ncbi:MAG: hypothetical protein AB1746_00820 [Candidatus Zixiibacteriota bacterium]
MSRIIIGSIGWLLIAFSAISANAQSNTQLAAPAEFVKLLTIPGSEDHLLRPGRILIEAGTNEIYVADPGNSRVTIFDPQGIYLYEFSTVEQCGAPLDLAIDSQGYIYVLGNTLQGPKIFIYDYDGAFISTFNPALAPDNKANISSIAISDTDILYALDLSGPRILGFDLDGNLETEMEVEKNMDETQRQELIFGTISVKDDVIYLPGSMVGTVYRFNINGKEMPSLGYKGSSVGELAFPISVDISADGIVTVLDKHRFTVVCFSQSGKFLGEFGGKGMRAGWFYHPTWLANGPENEIFIGQTYNNMVQVCRLPQFIVDRHLQIHSNNSNRGIDPQEATGGQKLQSEPESEFSNGTAMEPGAQHLFFSSHSVHRQDLDLSGINFNALKEVH